MSGRSNCCVILDKRGNYNVPGEILLLYPDQCKTTCVDMTTFHQRNDMVHVFLHVDHAAFENPML